MEYAQDNGYQPEDYNAPLTQDVVNYNSYPYNWWFGYPSWYPYDYWNPYPYWYDWGFYYGPGRHAVFFGLPSAYFMDWYFYYPEHFSRYAELSNYYYNYYDRHRESMNYNSISHSVNDWRNRNKEIITNDWDRDDANRTQRFREYGQMEMDRRNYNTRNPNKQIEQSEYLQKKQNKYPLLSADVSKNQLPGRGSRIQSVVGNSSEPVKQPTVTIPDHYKAQVNEQTTNRRPEQNPQKPDANVQNSSNNKQVQPSYAGPQPKTTDNNQRRDNTNVQVKITKPIKQTENFTQIRNAQQYQQNTWKQIQPQSQPVQQPQRQATTSPPRQQQNSQVERPVKQEIQTTPKNRRDN